MNHHVAKTPGKAVPDDVERGDLSRPRDFSQASSGHYLNLPLPSLYLQRLLCVLLVHSFFFANRIAVPSTRVPRDFFPTSWRYTGLDPLT